MKLKLKKTTLRDFHQPIVEHDIYTDFGLQQKTEDDEISSTEEGFMRGWLDSSF